MDTLGLVLEVRVHAANIQDLAGAHLVLQPLKTKHWRLKHIWADASYRGELGEWLRNLRQGRGHRRLQLEIVAKTKGRQFVVLPKRWIVERSFAWLNHSRRRNKDCDVSVASAEAFVYIANIRLMFRRCSSL